MPAKYQTFTNRGFSAEAYTTDGGKVWRWVSNSAVCPLDACKDYQIPCDPIAQQTARDKENETFFTEYRKRQANRLRMTTKTTKEKMFRNCSIKQQIIISKR